MHRAGIPVDLVVLDEISQQTIHGRLLQGRRWQTDVGELFQDIAEDRALAAAGSDGALVEFRRPLLGITPAHHRHGFRLPIDLHRLDVFEAIDQLLVFQISER